jgi:hypothetical protein
MPLGMVLLSLSSSSTTSSHPLSLYQKPNTEKKKKSHQSIYTSPVLIFIYLEIQLLIAYIFLI